MKRITLVLGTIVALGIILNAGYFWKQAAHRLNISEPPASLPVTGETGEPNVLLIERLSIQAPIVYISEEDEAVYQEALARGVVHYPGTAEIGRAGNAYIFGHSSDYPWRAGKYKTVFALLPDLEIGDIILATDQKGNVFRYGVVNSFIAPADATELLDQGDYQEKRLTLQTSYPLGTALKRFIVQAELIE